MRALPLSLLASLARAVVHRQRPVIVGVTGSVGKTSTREAIRAVLASRSRVRSAPKNYNNEIGFPVAIIGGDAPGRSLIRWVGLIARACALACVRSTRYPEVLVLEYGADHPGDLIHLIGIAAPTITVVTAVGPAHTEFFGTIERVVAEKQRLVQSLGSDGVAVLCRDDETVYGMRDRTRARTMTYGFHVEADVRGIEYQVTYNDQLPAPSSQLQASEERVPTGIAFKVVANGSTVPIHLTECLGRGHASAALAAVAVGMSQGMHLVDIAHALAGYVPPPGRSRIIAGIRGTTLIDDTYNASPLAVTVALEALGGLPTASRRIAVLGDMLELGTLAAREHARVGELAVSLGVDTVVAVGAESRALAAAARVAGMPNDRVIERTSAAEAGREVQDMLRPGDVVLVKGSQGMRMERVVKELMAEPLRARELLCRQGAEWAARS